MSAPDVEILWWEGCPSIDAFVADVRRTLAELGFAGAAVRLREIETDEQARAVGFVGSPTILVDGMDPFAADGEPTALACRIYRRRDGRISPTPDPEDLRNALLR